MGVKMPQQCLACGHGFFMRGSRDKRDQQSNLLTSRFQKVAVRLKMLITIRKAPEAISLVYCQCRCVIGVAGNKNFGNSSVAGDKRGTQQTLFYAKVLAVKINHGSARTRGPECPANRQELICPLITLVVGKEIAVVAQFVGSVPTNHV